MNRWTPCKREEFIRRLRDLALQVLTLVFATNSWCISIIA